MKHKWNYDCKSFPGVRACDILKNEGYESCEECKFYEPISKKILIVKLGAMGDVLRTTTLLTAIKKKYGEDCSITWIVNMENAEPLKNNHLIDRVLIHNLDNLLRLKFEKFEVLFSLEIDVPGIALANIVKCEERYGYFLNENGMPQSFKESGNYYLERVFSDRINQENKKTYQEMIFEICELPYSEERYNLHLSEISKQYASNLLKSLNLDENKKIIGINIGSGKRFPSRMVPKDKLVDIVKNLHTEYNIILLGGPEELRIQKEIIDELNKERIKVYKNDLKNSVEEFMGVVNSCDLIITGDSLAMHLSIGLGKKVIALFFSTPPSEIEGYNFVKKLISPLWKENLYTDEYSLDLLNTISVDEIVVAVEEILPKGI